MQEASFKNLRNAKEEEQVAQGIASRFAEMRFKAQSVSKDIFCVCGDVAQKSGVKESAASF